MKRFILLAIPFVLAGCAPAMPGDSVGDSARPPMVPYVPDFGHAPSAEQQMLEDPEAEVEESSFEVWASSQEEADRKCQAVADNWTEKGGTVVTVQGKAQQQTTRRSSNGQYKFTCTLRSEV